MPVRGRPVERTALRRLFGEVQFLRMVNRYGLVSVEYQETILARYRCAYDQRQRRLQDVSHPQFYQTPFASPQLELLERDEAQWSKVQQRAWYRRPRQVLQMAEQLPLLNVAGSVACFVPALLMYGLGKNFFRHVFTVI